MTWVEDELFWPAFLLQVGLARSAPDRFGADLADLDAYLDRFDDPDRWPVFSTPFGGGTMHLVVRNLADDHGIDWVLDREAEAAVDRLVEEQGGFFAGPGLPWKLLPDEPVHLLLSLPAMGDSTVPGQVPGIVKRALLAVGVMESAQDLADELLQYRACVLLQ
ncbi:hypothetical protein HDA40_001903 [Hamadaea flava]|uniref:Uncharacterized protein n=1 Tax=Hamadaea flava TaxID=1742688 RepID=A0ABV8LFC4_9ACTN|nr:hypothetical protein [Hamadaea flava]MCP2323396.1 hypothetical protein [Hamadaea flava]